MTKLEGSYQLGGLLEGPFQENQLPDLRQWREQCQASGLFLEFSMDGGHFSIIPSSEEPRLWHGTLELQAVLRAALESLLDRLGEQRTRCMSTLRSSEVFPGKERQSVYTLGPGAALQVEERTLDIATRPPSAWQRPAHLRKWTWGAALALLAFILITLPFVPYRRWLDRAKANVTVVEASNIRVDLGPFAPFLTKPTLVWDPVLRKYRLLLHLDEKALEENWRERASLTEVLAAGDLLRRRIRLEFLDAEQTSLQSIQAPLLPNQEEDLDNGSHSLIFAPLPRIHGIVLRL